MPSLRSLSTSLARGRAQTAVDFRQMLRKISCQEQSVLQLLMLSFRRSDNALHDLAVRQIAVPPARTGPRSSTPSFPQFLHFILISVPPFSAHAALLASPLSAA